VTDARIRRYTPAEIRTPNTAIVTYVLRDTAAATTSSRTMGGIAISRSDVQLAAASSKPRK
jgi:hypothetical protein